MSADAGASASTTAMGRRNPRLGWMGCLELGLARLGKKKTGLEHLQPSPDLAPAAVFYMRTAVFGSVVSPVPRFPPDLGLLAQYPCFATGISNKVKHAAFRF
jgi:hypothetical protein